MMRIKEAIQRRKLIQQLNDEYAAIEDDDGKNNKQTGLNGMRTTGSLGRGGDYYPVDGSQLEEQVYNANHQRAYLQLQEFVQSLKQPLRVTWKRLSEAPKTSGRGTLKIMEKVFEKLIIQNGDVMSVFYRSAFIKCINDRRVGGCPTGTIATVRDHAHMLIDLVDAIMCVMFDAPLQKLVWDPATIAHARLIPMGFDRGIWHKLGECFAEVMFTQECVQAYPHAASAWSTLSVAITDKMYTHSHIARSTDLTLRNLRLNLATSQLSLPNSTGSGGQSLRAPSPRRKKNSSSKNSSRKSSMKPKEKSPAKNPKISRFQEQSSSSQSSANAALKKIPVMPLMELETKKLKNSNEFGTKKLVKKNPKICALQMMSSSSQSSIRSSFPESFSTLTMPSQMPLDIVRRRALNRNNTISVGSKLDCEGESAKLTPKNSTDLEKTTENSPENAEMLTRKPLLKNILRQHTVNSVISSSEL